MKTRKRILVIVFLTSLVCAVAVWLVLASAGFLDSGKFEIVQSQVVSPNRVAMLARRSDHAALSGDTYFVVIADHLYAASELRKALYSSQPVFVAGRDGIEIHEANRHELIIQCKDCGITKDLFEKQRFSDQGISIRYVGFP